MELEQEAIKEGYTEKTVNGHTFMNLQPQILRNTP